MRISDIGPSSVNNVKREYLAHNFILALLAHSFNCAKISSALNVYSVYVHKTLQNQMESILKDHYIM